MPGSYGALPGEKGSGDPNILKLVEGATKVRPLDNVVAGWIQHGIEHPSDPEQFASVVCPGPRSCPLCRKPTSATGEQHFPRSKRYASNVWDHGTQQVKVLIAGPMVFNPFKEAASVGIMPDTCDWSIVKTGTRKNTDYQVIRHDVGPGPTVEMGQLHDVSKYEQPTSPEQIFEILERFGIDYDALTTPSYTYEEALKYVIPFGKNKGLTVEQLVSTELEYAEWLHGSRLEQGQLGDPTFVAIQVALEERGLVPPLEEALAMLPGVETPASAAPAVASAPGRDPDPRDNPAHELPTEVPPGMVRLISPVGVTADFPEAVKDKMVAVGFTELEPEPEPEPAATPGTMKVVVGGQEVELPTDAAVGLIAAGTATAVEAAPAPEPEPAPLSLPLPDEEVQVNVAGTVVPMPYVQAAVVVDNPVSNAHFDDPLLQAAHLAANARGAEAVANSPGTTPSSEPASTSGRAHDPEKPYECDQCTWAGKTAGSLTQHKNKEHKAAEPAPSAVPVNGNGDLRERVKHKIASAPFARDYQTLMAILKEETGIENFAEMDEAQLAKLEVRIDKEIAGAK